MADGDGWVHCVQGHVHWGVFGAAGLLVVAPAERRVLLQHRAAWSHGGDTWGVPGGARRRDESAVQAALRETSEETQLDVAAVVVDDVPHVVDHGIWSYETFVAVAPSCLPVVPERESVELRWVVLDEVDALPLHHAFRDAWPALRQRLP